MKRHAANRLLIMVSLLMMMLTHIQAQDMTQIRYKTIEVDGIEIFYREAGDPAKPALLLLHGFPASSHMFREFMPHLAADYYLVAPDFPGFGNTETPPREEFTYTFDHLSRIVDHFTEKIDLGTYAMYIFDYGAPIGLRLAMWHPERVQAIITQNGNAYLEGLGPKWEARKEYWKNPTPELRKQYSVAYSLPTIKGQYVDGTPEASVGPDGYTLDFAYVNLPGRSEIQNDLIFDYQTNVALYPDFQKYLRTYTPPVLAVWGKNDPSFIPPGAEAFKRDVPDAEVHYVESGHFALESHHKEIAELTREFLQRKWK